MSNNHESKFQDGNEPTILYYREDELGHDCTEALENYIYDDLGYNMPDTKSSNFWDSLKVDKQDDNTVLLSYLGEKHTIKHGHYYDWLNKKDYYYLFDVEAGKVVHIEELD